MAIYNEILNARFSRMLQKVFSMKGGQAVRALGGEVSPAFPLFSGAENRFLESWDRFQSSDFQAAVAAQPSTCRIRNPLGSNVAAVIESCRAVGDTAVGDQYIFERGQVSVDLANIVAPSAPENVDSPRSLRARALIISTQAAAGQSTGMVQISAGSGPVFTSFDFIGTDIQELQLMPGEAVQVRRVTVNVALTMTWLWRERPLEASELV